MQDVGLIYLMLNKINNKKYVGQTVQSENRRLSKHKSDSAGSSQSAIHRAIRKHGWENFEVSVIWEGPIESLNEQESFFIREHNSLSPFGYNLTTGGQASREIAEETKEKISAGLVSNWADSGYREKVIATRKQTWSNPELLRKRSEAAKKRWEDPEFRENMQAALQAALDTPEIHEIRSQNTKKMWETEEQRNKIIEQMKITASTPEEKERKSRKSKAAWKNPERKQKGTEAMKKRWQDPEFRKKMAQVQRDRWDKQKGINEQPCA